MVTVNITLDTSQLLALAGTFAAAAQLIEAGAERAVAKTANDIEATSKGSAPVDTGDLRNSISSDVRSLSAEIGPSVEYGIYQELGTSRMGAQPFMGPAFDQHVEGFVSAIELLGGRI